jgi:hypothetical protein
VPRGQRFRAGQQAPENRDLARDSSAAKLDAFLDASHRESVGPGIRECSGDLDGAVAVGIRLDHGVQRRAGSRQAPQRRQVAGQRIEVDLRPGRARQRR